MRLIPFVALLTLSTATGAVDKVHSLNVKPGLWEVTTTVTANAEIPIPAALLEKLTPEQRARIRDRIDARKTEPGKTTTRKQCLTRKQLQSGIPFGPDEKSCTRMTFTSSRSKADMRLKCFDPGTNSHGTLQIRALSPESVKGSLSFSVDHGDNATNSTSSSFTAKWIGPICHGTK